MEIRLIRRPMPLAEVRALAQTQFGDMIKAAVDVERGVMALGGELHSDEEALLLDDGSRQEDVWGINIYPDKPDPDRVEFDAMINLRPAQGNRTRGVRDPQTRDRILAVVARLVSP